MLCSNNNENPAFQSMPKFVANTDLSPEHTTYSTSPYRCIS